MTVHELKRVLEWMPKTGKTPAGMARIIRDREKWPEDSQEEKVLKQFDKETKDDQEWLRFFDRMIQWSYLPDKLHRLVFEESRYQRDGKINLVKATYIRMSIGVYDEIRRDFCPDLDPWRKKAEPLEPGLENVEVR